MGLGFKVVKVLYLLMYGAWGMFGKMGDVMWFDVSDRVINLGDYKKVFNMFSRRSLVFL